MNPFQPTIPDESVDSTIPALPADPQTQSPAKETVNRNTVLEIFQQ